MSKINWNRNQFHGSVIDPDSISDNSIEFASDLNEVINEWRTENIKLAWMQLNNTKLNNLIYAIQQGFIMHHACEEYVMLTYKVEPDAFVPPYATHYIGIGGVVINDKKEILVVSERYRSGSTPSFKLPGGALLAGEHLSDAVIREVKEETGIDTVFHKLTFFRHWHEYRYGKSDIYFVALLSPLNEKIDMQLDEIVDCKWMPLEEFMSDEHIHEFNKTIVESTFDSKGLSNIKIEEYKPDTRFEFYSS